MKVKDVFNGDFSSNNIIEKSPEVKDQLTKYFEGVSVGLVKFLLEDFRKSLDAVSIVSIEKS